MPKFIDLKGKTFGRLTVLKRVQNRGKNVCWLCQCCCGKTKEVCARELFTGHTMSCGCLMKEKASYINKTHGLSKNKLYKIWCGIKSRCYNKNQKSFYNYGQRGITMCDEWKNDFMSFYNWAIQNGYKDNLTIDRIDVNGNYCPENCRWTTAKEQANNTRRNKYITYEGKTKTLNEWSALLFNGKYHILHDRLFKLNWNIKKAFTTPIRKMTFRK